MTQRCYAWVLSLAVAAVGCSDSPSDGVERNVDASSQAIRAAVHSNAALASKLAGALRDEAGNLFYSPLSIEAVSGMLLAGAAGDTAAQLSALLDATNDPSALHKGLGSLLRDLRHEHPQYTLSVANRLWAVQGLESSPAFTSTTRDDYDAPTQLVDFASDPDAARTDINHWVSQQTAAKIPELLKQGQITRDTVMAVVNAMYFKADWATAFNTSHTRMDTFYRADKSEVKVEMMSSDDMSVRATFQDESLWLELPYRTGDVSFLVYTKQVNLGTNDNTILSVQELQDALSGVDIGSVVARLEEVSIGVEMPRFSLRSRIDLVPVFEKLGVTDLFDSGRADLTNIDAKGRLYVDPFVHEAAVSVDEIGTVAVAATGGGARAVSASVARINRPFLFFIRDNLTGAILFSGQVADPSDSGDN